MSPWQAALAAALVAVFAILGLFHVAWAAGARKATGVIPEVAGKPAFAPGPVVTLLVAATLFGCALLIAALAGWVALPLPTALLRWANLALALAFFARAIGDFRLVGIFKKVRGTPFARLDSRYYSPLCLVIAIAAGLLLAR